MGQLAAVRTEADAGSRSTPACSAQSSERGAFRPPGRRATSRTATLEGSRRAVSPSEGLQSAREQLSEVQSRAADVRQQLVGESGCGVVPSQMSAASSWRHRLAMGMAQQPQRIELPTCDAVMKTSAALRWDSRRLAHRTPFLGSQSLRSVFRRRCAAEQIPERPGHCNLHKARGHLQALGASRAQPGWRGSIRRRCPRVPPD